MNLESLQYLQTSFARIDELIRWAVNRAQAAGHDPTDALRGLIISQEEVEAHLNQPVMAGLWLRDTPTSTGEQVFKGQLRINPTDSDLPFLNLLQTFELSDLDAYILLICLAPELDRRYERLYAYLQDDVSQRRPTINLMMNLLGADVEQRFLALERVQPYNPLRKHLLIDAIPDSSRPNGGMLSYHLKVDARVIAYLLGDSTPDERLRFSVQLEADATYQALPEEVLMPVYQALPESPFVYLKGIGDVGQREVAALLCGAYQMPLVRIEANRLKALEGAPERGVSERIWRLALREGYLHRAALLIMHWETLLNEHQQPEPWLWTTLLEYPRTVFFVGQNEWEPTDHHRQRRLLRLNFPAPSYDERRQFWEEFTAAERIQAIPKELDSLANKYRFSRVQIARAVRTAADLAASRGEIPTERDLYSGAQAHAHLRLGNLARRIIPKAKWSDLVLPPDQMTQLQEMTSRARHNFMVQEKWGFGRRVNASPGISALFAGESGTGKTLTAEVIAGELELVMYKIDLSAVVSKYIGETEKNLNVIFTEAQSSNAILFFDEADALFGKRSEVKDARDRYANIEIAYLLQQIEEYTGIAILATNLRRNLDDAFTRRLDFLIDFPFPSPEYRRKIWEIHFPPGAPLAKDVNLAEIAERYHLAGGNIRNAALAAAYLAAANGQTIANEHIRHAIRREHQKMGRLIDERF